MAQGHDVNKQKNAEASEQHGHCLLGGLGVAPPGRPVLPVCLSLSLTHPSGFPLTGNGTLTILRPCPRGAEGWEAADAGQMGATTGGTGSGPW